MNSSPTTEERIWAVISHLSALAFGMGLALTILGWSEQRRKSKYASFQCLQALGYQSLGYTVWLLSYLVLVILLTIILLIYVTTSGENGGPAIAAWSVAFVLLILGLLGLYFLLPIVAAIACGFGKDFRYPLLGTRLANYLDFQAEEDGSFQVNEENEERWVASMGHFSVIVAFWGLFAPLATWILQGKRSAFLRFQSIQTTIYQGIVNILFIGAGGVYSLGILVTFLTAVLSKGADIREPAVMSSLLIFFAALLIAALIALAIPFFHILGQWAGYRVLKGDNYRYPLLGRMVEKRLAKSDGVQAFAPDSTEENS